MRPVPASVKAPKLPQVNLVPPEIGMRRNRSKQRAGVLAIVLVFLAAVGGLSYWVTTLKAEAAQSLAQAEDEYALLQAEAQQYSEVPLVLETLSNATDARAFTGATEVDFALLLTEAAAAVPGANELGNLTFAKVGLQTDNPTPTSAGVFARPVIGVLLFEVYTTQFVDAAEVTEALQDMYGFEGARVTVSTRDLDPRELEEDNPSVIYIVEIEVGMSVDRLTQRFAPEIEDLEAVNEEGGQAP